jgi:formate-dependent nitrite reductase cytochrome c552 subunit
MSEIDLFSVVLGPGEWRSYDYKHEETGAEVLKAQHPEFELIGFHAPQEAARVPAEAVEYSRQGQVAAMSWRSNGE